MGLVLGRPACDQPLRGCWKAGTGAEETLDERNSSHWRVLYGTCGKQGSLQAQGRPHTTAAAAALQELLHSCYLDALLILVIRVTLVWACVP